MTDPALVLGPPDARLLVTEIDGTVTIYDPARSEVHLLNESATAVWRLLDGRRTVADVTAAVAALYGVDADEVAPHVERAVAELAARDLFSNE